MKKQFLILALIGLIGQLTGFVGIFVSETSDDLMLSLWTFLIFGSISGIAILLDNKKEKISQSNILSLHSNQLILINYVKTYTNRISRSHY